ncbi:MAG: tetratricopeptide repeat protein, partial [Hamadaea sp.]|nr:tetratricopeptide repeat protein [Hamadaea sp.]
NAILRGDEDLRVAAVEPERPAPRVVPAQGPAAPADLSGRQAVGAASGRAFGGAAPGVVLLCGPGGSGKSALAAHAAEGLAAAFPDGRLYAELRGTSDSPATADRVLGGFLRSLGVDDGRLPASTQDRAELFRSLLADRRVLVVLDDAADEAQVRPLLPGGSGSGALVTSRYRLAGLAGAALIELDVLSDEQAWELLTHIVGAPRLAADPAAASRILALCENLPLAIRIAGARLAMRQRLPVRLLADRLADEWQRLDELSAGDLAVRASIELSYRALAPDAQAALRRMGFLGLPDCAPWIVGLLLGVPMTRAETLLESLVDAQLVTFAGVDRLGILRYRMHDLVRLFASERARAEDPAEELTDAVAAVTYGWFALAEDITASSPPAETVWRAERPDPVAVDDEVVKAVLADPSAWLQDEESRIAVGVEKAAGLGLHHPVSELVRGVIAAERYGAGRFEFRTRIIEAALAASQRARHGRGEALMLAELAQLRYAQDRFDEARRHFADVLERFRDLGDLRGQAVALTGLGVCCREPGLLTEAIAHLDQAAALAVTFGDDGGIGYVHRLRGSVLLEQGEYAAARADLDRSLAAYRTIGSRRGVALTLRTLGMYHRARGEYGPALAACAESASIFQECDDELMHSYAVRAHAKVQVRMGRAGEALPRLEQALAVTRAYGDRWGQACNLHVLGQLHLSEDRPGLAASCLGAAMSLWDELAAPLWRARTLHVVSLLHTRQGEHASAQTVLAQALAVFRQRGSREYKEIKDYLKVH